MKDVIISVRTSKAERTAIQKVAQSKNRSVSDFSRLLLLEQVEEFDAIMGQPAAADSTIARRKTQSKKAEALK